MMEIEEQVYHQMNKIRRNSRDQGKLESNCVTFKFDLKQLYKDESKQSKGEHDYGSMIGPAKNMFGEVDQMKKMMGMMNGGDRGGSMRDQTMGDREQILSMMQMMGGINPDQIQRVRDGDVVMISDDQAKKMMAMINREDRDEDSRINDSDQMKKMMHMLNGGDRQHSIKEQMMGSMGDRDQMLKMMQMMNGGDRENSVKQQMMGDRDQMQEMMQMMNDRKREDSMDFHQEHEIEKIMQVMSNQDDYSMKDKMMHMMNNREREGSVMDKVKEMGNNMSLDEMMEMMDVDNDQMQNIMQMMHNGDDYSMKENMLNMMNNKERRESDNQSRYETGQYQNYRNRA